MLVTIRKYERSSLRIQVQIFIADDSVFYVLIQTRRRLLPTINLGV